METEILGAIKIKDGLFVGDEFAAQDLEFVVANKVSHIINASAKQIPNHWEPIGVKYLPFYWFDSDSQVLFDSKKDLPEKIFQFIETAVDQGESVLVNSVRGQGRCMCVVATYLMRKYRWNLEKTLEFLNARRPDINIRQTFLDQLNQVAERFTLTRTHSTKWTEVNYDNEYANEEVVLRNTFINARMKPEESDQAERGPAEPVVRINWADANSGSVSELVDVPHPSAKNPIEDGFAVIRSCVKGKAQVETRVPIYQFKAPKKKVQYGTSPQKTQVDINEDDLNKLVGSLEGKRETKLKKKPVEFGSEKKRRPRSQSPANKQRPSSVKRLARPLWQK